MGRDEKGQRSNCWQDRPVNDTDNRQLAQKLRVTAAPPDYLNLSQFGDEKADHKIWAIVQTALFAETVKRYPQRKVKN
jgi:hypothetical protein